MSKERARRRAALVAEREQQRLERERRQRRQARIGRLRPRVGRLRRRRRVKPWTRRTRRQRAAVVALGLAAVIMTFLFVESWPIRLAIFALVAIGTPALTTLAMDRSRG